MKLGMKAQPKDPKLSRSIRLGVLAIVSATVMSLGLTQFVAEQPASALSGTYCSVKGKGCQLYKWPSTNNSLLLITPGPLTAGMICWQDGEWTNLNYWTNRWFKMNSAVYGIFWAPASEVYNQTRTPRC